MEEIAKREVELVRRTRWSSMSNRGGDLKSRGGQVGIGILAVAGVKRGRARHPHHMGVRIAVGMGVGSFDHETTAVVWFCGK